MATHSSILAWRIPWTEEPKGPQSMGSKSWPWLNTYAGTDWRLKHNLWHLSFPLLYHQITTKCFFFTHKTHSTRKITQSAFLSICWHMGFTLSSANWCSNTSSDFPMLPHSGTLRSSNPHPSSPWGTPLPLRSTAGGPKPRHSNPQWKTGPHSGTCVASSRWTREASSAFTAAPHPSSYGLPSD